MATENRRGLGRGLSALLGENETTAEGSGGAREIPVELIHRNPDQPRSDFDETELEELAASMRQKGVLQPIMVRPSPHAPGQYQIVAGERRWRAAQRAGLAAMPAVVRQLGDIEALEIALIENIQRADLNAIEEAGAYMALMGLGQTTQEALADIVGKSRSHVANALRLLQLPEAVQAMVRGRALSAGHARAIIGAPDVEALARRIVDEGLTVRETEALARQAGPAPAEGAPRTGRPPTRKNADTLALERDLSERLGLQVEVIDKEGSGEVRVRYRSFEQLDEVCRRLSRT